jgi:hypothetical protein
MDKVTAFQDSIFTIIIIISYILYILFAVGLSGNAASYLADLDYYVKIYVSLFLMWRFNMFRSVKFTELDRKIAFTAGVFLFTSTALNKILISYFTKVKSTVSKKM